MSHDYSEARTPATQVADCAAKDPFDCFSYLVCEKRALYRALITIFIDAKSGFRLHLRPADVVQRLYEQGERSFSQSEVEAALDSLVDWGNLQSYHDTAEVATVADFHRRRLLYQLTAAGESAARAARTFLEALDQSVVLEAAALSRIRDYLAELKSLAEESQLDGGKILMALDSISRDAQHLTEHAQSFFRWLHEQTEGPSTDLDAFLHYKERLIDYLRRFLAELASQAGAIASRIEVLHPQADRLLQAAAEQETSDAFSRDESDRQVILTASLRRWQVRWHGLRHWFVGVGAEPQVKQLRCAAGAAIPRLLALAAQLHDRRVTRSDRRADLVELAVWFVQSPDDRAAHRLWRGAFSLSPARHLIVNETTLDQLDAQQVRAGTSWLDAPGVYISPQLRQTGRQPSASARRVISRTAEIVELRRRSAIEQQRTQLARSSLIALGRRRLSEVAKLNREALLMLLDLLDRAAATCHGANCPATADSDDGSLRIRVEELDQITIATINTSDGCLHLRDALIEIEDVDMPSLTLTGSGHDD